MTATNETRVRLAGGEVACDIVADGQLVFSRKVPQFELWRVRSQLRQRTDIHVDLRLLAMQQLERIEAEVYSDLTNTSPANYSPGIDWLVWSLVALNIVVCLGLIGWAVLRLVSVR